MSISGTYITIEGCTVTNTTNDGIKVDVDDSKINGNTIINTGSYGIKYQGGDRGECSHNYIYHASQWGAGIGLSTSQNITVAFNTIRGTGTTYPNLGVYQGNYCNILFNNAIGVQYPTYGMGANNNVYMTGTNWNG